MRRLNIPYLVVLMGLGAAAAGGAFLLHGWQKRKQAPLVRARAEAQAERGDLRGAIDSYRRYLALAPGDGRAWAHYARLMDRATPPGTDRGPLFLIHGQALRIIGEDEELERRAIDLALELGRGVEARRRLESLIGRLERDPGRPPGLAELEEKLGRHFEDDRKFAEAEGWYRRAIGRAPGRVAVRERLAAMLRRDLKRADEADREIAAMVETADRPAEALAARWRHREEFGLGPDPEDARKAVELAPEDPGPRLVAARAALLAADLEAARVHLAEGIRIAPTDRSFPLMAAGLESAAGRPERAAELLAEAVKVFPDDLQFQGLMAENLILRGELDGEEGAEGLVDRLAKAGLAEGYVRLLRAQILMGRERWREAMEGLEAARTLLMSDRSVLGRVDLLLAECQSRFGADQESLASLRRAAGAPGGPASRMALAAALERAGRFDEAIQVHLGLQAERPESRLDEVRLRIALESTKPEAGRSWEAVEARLKAAEDANPHRGEPLLLLRAELLAARGRGGEAWALLSDEIRREPDRLSYRLELASLAIRGEAGPSRGAGAAVAILDRAEQDLGDSAAIRMAKIEAAAALPRDQARGLLDEYVRKYHAEAAPAGGDWLDRLAGAYSRIGDLDKADELLAEAGRSRPGDLELLLQRADAAIARGDQARCREVAGLLKGIEGEPGTLWRYVEASALLLRLASEPAATRAPLRDAADALVRDILERRKGWWGGTLLRGRLAESEGRLDDAAGDYAQAIEAGAAQPELARRTVLLLAELGRFQESDRIAHLVAGRGSGLEGFKLAAARNALSGGEYDRAVALTREVVSETSDQVLDLLFLARVLEAAGRHAEAEKPSARAVALAPADGMVWIAWVRHLVVAGRGREVPAALDRAAKAVDPKSAPLTLAIARSAAGDDVGAAPLFASALTARPDDVATIRAAAEFAIKVLDLNSARPLVDRLLDPRTAAGPEAVAWARRASVLFTANPGDPRRIDEAVALIDENLKANPLAVEDQRARAVLLAMNPGRRVEAVRELEALHAKRRLSREDRLLLARLHDQRGDRDRWRSLMNDLMAEPDPEPAHVAAFARRWIELGDPVAAAEALTKARPRTPEDERTLLETRCFLLRAEKRESEIPALIEAQARSRPDQGGLLGSLLESFGLFPEAERALRGWAAKSPEDPMRKLALAQFLGRRDKLAEAVGLGEQAAAASPPNVLAAVAMELLGSAKAPTPEQEARLAALVEQAADRAPDAADVLLQLALLRSRQGRPDEAEKVYGRILAVSPDDAAALNDLAWLLGSRDKDLDRAAKLADRALEILGPDASLLDTRAMIHLKRNEPSAAIQDVDQALALAPRKSILLLRKAEALLMSQQLDEARLALRRAEDLGAATASPSSLERTTFEALSLRLK